MRIFFAVFCLSVATAMQAATLNLDPARSQITISGNVAGFKLSEQGPGSLTTTVGGTVDITTLGGQIQITGATLDVNSNGSWAPGLNGQAKSPADLAGQASTLFGPITGAFRDLVVNAIGPVKPLAPNGQFDASAIVFSFPLNSTSVLDYDSFITGAGHQNLAGGGTNQAATVGTLIDSNGTQTLTIGLNATFFFTLAIPNDTALTLTGQLVATSAPAATPPQISGIQFTNGLAIITATKTLPTTKVESTRTFNGWTSESPIVTVIDSSTRTFTLQSADKFRFFRLAN